MRSFHRTYEPDIRSALKCKVLFTSRIAAAGGDAHARPRMAVMTSTETLADAAPAAIHGLGSVGGSHFQLHGRRARLELEAARAVAGASSRLICVRVARPCLVATVGASVRARNYQGPAPTVASRQDVSRSLCTTSYRRRFG